MKTVCINEKLCIYVINEKKCVSVENVFIYVYGVKEENAKLFITKMFHYNLSLNTTSLYRSYYWVQFFGSRFFFPDPDRAFLPESKFGSGSGKKIRIQWGKIRTQTRFLEKEYNKKQFIPFKLLYKEIYIKSIFFD